jgi:hypothetical protein
LELGEYAFAHLCRGFLGEGDREDLFGRLDRFIREELEVSLDEQARLTGASGCFDDP